MAFSVHIPGGGMAFASDEDRKYLAERGFSLTAGGFVRTKDRFQQMIAPAWLGQRQGNLSAPGDGNNVRWTATQTSYKPIKDAAGAYDIGIPYVSVTYADACMDPTTAFITAEIRNWQRPGD